MNDLPPNEIETQGADAEGTSAIEEVRTGWMSEAYDSILEVVTGVPAPIRKNATKALAQLCTAAAEWPAAYLKGRADESRALSKARVKLIETSGEKIAEQIDAPLEYSRAALKKYGDKILRERVNLDEIGKATVQELTIGSDGKNPDAKDKAVLGDPPKEIQEISDDFLNAFEIEAAPKSSKEMQQFFAKILAGEIRKPGTFSIRTLKTMGEIDEPIAKLFQKLCSCSVSMKGVENEFILDARAFALGGNAAANSLQKFGLGFGQLNTLHEYGLINPDYNSYFDYVASIADPMSNTVQLPFYHQTKFWSLVPKDANVAVPNQLRLNGAGFSKVGRELFTIVETSPKPEYTEALKQYFRDKGLEMTEVAVHLTNE